MIRAAVVLASVLVGAGLLPDACGKVSVRRQASHLVEQPPTPQPLTSATTPPVWSPPESSAPPAPSATPPNPDLAKARQLAQSGEHKKVRALLEKKVRAGKSTREEAELLVESCIALRDKACMDTVKTKHPEIDGL